MLFKIILLMIFAISCSTSSSTSTNVNTSSSNIMEQNSGPKESERKMIYVKITQAKDTADYEEMSGGGNATILFNTAKRRIASDHQITMLMLESIEREGRDNNWITM